MRSLLALLALLPALAAGAAPSLDLTPSLLLEGESRELAHATGNPGNRILALPAGVFGMDGRLEAKASASVFDLTLRPRGTYFRERVNGNGQGVGDLFFQEAFLRANVADWLSASAGRIQFGWGPAESVSPSNWFAPEIQWQASPYFEQLGVYRGQWNFTVGQGFSFVALHEFPALRDHWSVNREPPRDAFRRRWLGKAEWNWDNTNKVLGFVGGQYRGPEGVTGRLGGYGSWTLSDAWQVYFDAVWRQVAGASPDWKALGVAGARYTFPGGAEFRLEGIHNGAGQDKAGFDRNRTLLARLPDSALSALSAQRESTLLTRDYAYLAFRWSNPAFLESVLNSSGFGLRLLQSLTENSGSLLGSFECGLGTSFNLSLYAQTALGPPDREMRQLYDRLAGVVFKTSF